MISLISSAGGKKKSISILTLVRWDWCLLNIFSLPPYPSQKKEASNHPLLTGQGFLYPFDTKKKVDIYRLINEIGYV